MDAKKCDRCGIFYQTNRDYYDKVGYNGIVGFATTNKDKKIVHVFDLCEDCVNDLKTFARNDTAYQRVYKEDANNELDGGEDNEK